MQLRLFRCAIGIVLGAVITATLVNGASQTASPSTLVEVSIGGDDGLTLRLRDSIERAFDSSPDFRVAAGKDVASLFVLIPRNVKWTQVGKRTKVFYVAEFTDGGNRQSTLKGSCWEDNFDKCASQIVKRARSIARK